MFGFLSFFFKDSIIIVLKNDAKLSFRWTLFRPKFYTDWQCDVEWFSTTDDSRIVDYTESFLIIGGTVQNNTRRSVNSCRGSCAHSFALVDLFALFSRIQMRSMRLLVVWSGGRSFHAEERPEFSRLGRSLNLSLYQRNKSKRRHSKYSKPKH